MFSRAQKCALTIHIYNSDYHYKFHYVKLKNYGTKNNSYYLHTLRKLLVKYMDIALNPGPMDDLQITHLNVRSLRNKTDILESELQTSDIICLTETHLKPDIQNNEINIESHPNDPHRRDRTFRPGGEY